MKKFYLCLLALALTGLSTAQAAPPAITELSVVQSKHKEAMTFTGCYAKTAADEDIESDLRQLANQLKSIGCEPGTSSGPAGYSDSFKVETKKGKKYGEYKIVGAVVVDGDGNGFQLPCPTLPVMGFKVSADGKDFTVNFSERPTPEIFKQAWKLVYDRTTIENAATTRGVNGATTKSDRLVSTDVN